MREPTPQIPQPQLILNNKEIQQTDTTDIISIKNIATAVEKLQKDKTPGLSAIPIKYYYWGGQDMYQILHKWYKIIEKHQYTPKSLNASIIAPLQKSDTSASMIIKQDPKQYRPIALQNSMYKILDGCIKQEIEKHDELNQIIEINQRGFKQKEGTIEQLYALQNIVHYNSNHCCAFLDLSKAHDTVNRNKLFLKLTKQHKLNNNTINLLKAMYTDAQICTRIDDKISPLDYTRNGLQQGALSSPILNLYINDLIQKLNKQNIGATFNTTGQKNKLKINSLLFADDIMLAENPTKLQRLLRICTE